MATDADFTFPSELAVEPSGIPDFWISSLDDVNAFLENTVVKGEVKTIGYSAGGRPIKAAFYGEPRKGPGTTTFSGSLGFKNVAAYLGPDHAKKVWMALGAVHGDEWEGIVGLTNLIAVLETGEDLSGRPWPEITAAAGRLDRIIIIPVVNVDGRARLPVRMRFNYGLEKGEGSEYFGTGVWLDGSAIGWPTCKEFIPLDLSRIRFPGGYPNDAGVNIQHDDFLGHRQPETEALLDLVAAERPDLTMNMHTGAPPRNYFIRMHRPFADPKLQQVFDGLYRRVHRRLAQDGLQGSTDLTKEADPTLTAGIGYNLDTALSLHCGTLSVLVESPAHYFDGHNRLGGVVHHTPADILNAHLTVHQESMGFLVEQGGRARWAK